MANIDSNQCSFANLKKIEKKIDMGIKPSAEDMAYLKECSSKTNSTPKLVDNSGKPVTLKKGNLQQDTFGKDKPKEESFVEKHKTKLGIAGMMAGPVIAFAGIGAAIAFGAPVMMPALIVGGLVGLTGFSLFTSK